MGRQQVKMQSHPGGPDVDSSINIRPLAMSDVEAIHLIQLQPEVLPFILSVPTLRLSEVEKRFQELGPNDHRLVAERDGHVIGLVGLQRYSGRLSHSGLIFIYVDSACHGQGIGTALLKAVIDLADNWLMLERLELTFLATNPRAQTLYERLGFAVEGRKRGSIVSQGQFVDEIAMARIRPAGGIASSSDPTLNASEVKEG